MISIRDTVEVLWFPCPKCGMSQMITEWGEQTCRYIGCDKYKYIIEYNLETATNLLEEIQYRNIRERNLPKPPEIRPSMPRLQKVHSGWILIPQSPTANKDFWYRGK